MLLYAGLPLKIKCVFWTTGVTISARIRNSAEEEEKLSCTMTFLSHIQYSCATKEISIAQLGAYQVFWFFLEDDPAVQKTMLLPCANAPMAHRVLASRWLIASSISSAL